RGGVTLPQQAAGFTYTLAVSGYVADGGRWLMAAAVNPQGRAQLYRTRIPNAPVSAGDTSVSWIMATNYTLPPVTSLLTDGHFSAVIGTVSGPYMLNGGVVMEVSQIKPSTVAPSPTPSPVPPTNTPQPTATPAATQAPNVTATAVATSASSVIAAGATPIAAPAQPSALGAPGAPGVAGNRGLPASVGTLSRTKVAPSGGVAISGEAGMGLTVGADAFIADVDVVIASLTRPDPPGTLRYGNRLNYAQQSIPMLDGTSLDEVPLYTTSDDTRVWAVAGTPYDVRFVDTATGREISNLPRPFDLTLQYSLNDFPIGGSEFDLALGRWDEIGQRWVRLPVTPDGMRRQVRSTLDTPGVVALMTLAPMSFPTQDGAHVYPTTGQSVAPAVFDVINGNGGAPRAGFPITGEIDNENGVFSQHFSRARVDVIPGTGQVRLGNIGSTFLSMIGITFPGGPDEGSSPEHRYFPETGHYVSYGFLSYYDAINGPSSLGQPISPQMLDMAGKVVQYFTSGRLEWNASLGRVELGNLGEDLYRLMEERRAQGALDVLIMADGSVPVAAELLDVG
ncbi:MAG TPA: hypothetical protein VGW38_12945, partial [Chloroflexota bacterium]|nr:hypothetical protein [Chloroflexota bacterium]